MYHTPPIRKPLAASLEAMTGMLLFWSGLSRKLHDFIQPMLKASDYFDAQEAKKFWENTPAENLEDYMNLYSWNISLFLKALDSSQEETLKYVAKNAEDLTKAIFDDSVTVDDVIAKKTAALKQVVLDMPKAVKDIRKEYGFHFDTPGYEKVAETSRMLLYQVLPNRPGVTTNAGLKPVIIAHPYVLGANIMAFLPNEGRSFVHAFANKEIPTYVRIIKDIDTTDAVQIMTGEDDVLDTRYFSQIVRDRHHKPVTLVGVCQGGFMLMAGILTGRLEGLVDALITCASPLDGSLSKGLKTMLDQVNDRFRELDYSVKTLPNGNRVVDGAVMSWVYKLKSLEREAPVYAYISDLERAERSKGAISKTAAAINYWLLYDRTDLPVEITALSRLSYTVPIAENGDLPIELFGKKLNVKYLDEHNVKFLICYGTGDELVEPASALAPAKHVHAEKTPFPKGHAAIFTSWSSLDSEYALDKVYKDGSRGPVRFQLDLSNELPKAGKVTDDRGVGSPGLRLSAARSPQE